MQTKYGTIHTGSNRLLQSGCELAGHSRSLEFLCSVMDKANNEYLYRQDKSDDGNRAKRLIWNVKTTSTPDLSHFREPNLFLYCGGVAYVPPYLWDSFLMACAQDIQASHQQNAQQKILASFINNGQIRYDANVPRMYFSEKVNGNDARWDKRRLTLDLDWMNIDHHTTLEEMKNVARIAQETVKKYFRSNSDLNLEVIGSVSLNRIKFVAPDRLVQAPPSLSSLVSAATSSNTDMKDIKGLTDKKDIKMNANGLHNTTVQTDQKDSLSTSFSPPSSSFSSNPPSSISNTVSSVSVTQSSQTVIATPTLDKKKAKSMLALHVKQNKEKQKKRERVPVKKNGTHLSFEFIIVNKERTDQIIYTLRQCLVNKLQERLPGSNPWKTVVDSVTTSGLRLNGSRKADPCEICMDKKKTRKDKEICSNCNGLRKVDQGDDTVYGVAFVLDSNGNDDFQKANFLKDPQNAHTMLRSTCQWVPYDLSVMEMNDDGSLSGVQMEQELTEGYEIPAGASIQDRITESENETRVSKTAASQVIDLQQTVLTVDSIPIILEYNNKKEKQCEKSIFPGSKNYYANNSIEFTSVRDFFLSRIPEFYKDNSITCCSLFSEKRKQSVQWVMRTNSKYCMTRGSSHLNNHIFFCIEKFGNNEPFCSIRCWDSDCISKSPRGHFLCVLPGPQQKILGYDVSPQVLAKQDGSRRAQEQKKEIKTKNSLSRLSRPVINPKGVPLSKLLGKQDHSVEVCEFELPPPVDPESNVTTIPSEGSNDVDSFVNRSESQSYLSSSDKKPISNATPSMSLSAPISRRSSSNKHKSLEILLFEESQEFKNSTSKLQRQLERFNAKKQQMLPTSHHYPFPVQSMKRTMSTPVILSKQNPSHSNPLEQTRSLSMSFLSNSFASSPSSSKSKNDTINTMNKKRHPPVKDTYSGSNIASYDPVSGAFHNTVPANTSSKRVRKTLDSFSSSLSSSSSSILSATNDLLLKLDSVS